MPEIYTLYDGREVYGVHQGGEITRATFPRP